MYTRLSPYVLNSVLIVSASLALAGCSGQSLPGSQLFGQNVYVAPVLKPLKTIANNVNASLLWQVNTGTNVSNVKVHPFINNTAIYTANGITLSAWNKQTGAALWSNPVGQLISGGVNGDENTVYAGTQKGKAVALDAKTGKNKWVADLGTEVLAVSSASLGRIVFRTIDGKLHGVDSNTGEVVWQRIQRTPQLSFYGASVPIVVDKGVIAGFDNGKLAAYDLISGKPIWEVTLSVPKGSSELDQLIDIDGRLKPLGNGLFASNNNGRLALIAMSSGKVQWARVFSSITGADANPKAVLSADEKGLIWKIRPEDGKRFWNQDDLQNRKPTTPTLTSSGSHAVIGDKQGNIHWINTENGEISARISGDPMGYHTPMLTHGDTVYALGKGGVLTAIRSR